MFPHTHVFRVNIIARKKLIHIIKKDMTMRNTVSTCMYNHYARMPLKSPGAHLAMNALCNFALCNYDHTVARKSLDF